MQLVREFEVSAVSIIHCTLLLLGTRVKKEALPKLLILLSPVVCSWDLFAQLIGVPPTQISQIKAVNPKTGPRYLYTCFTQALEWWEANHGNPVYESMIGVLDPGVGKVTPVMNRALASELREFMAKQRGGSSTGCDRIIRYSDSSQGKKNHCLVWEHTPTPGSHFIK